MRLESVSSLRLALCIGVAALALAPIPDLAFPHLVYAQAPAVPATSQKISLSYKAQMGRTKTLTSSGTFTLEFGGQKANVEFKQVEKATITSVAPHGDITYDNKVESSEATINGQKMPDDPDDHKDVDTITIRPDGTLASFKSTAMDKDQARLSARLFPAAQPVFSDKPVGIGDKWVREVKGDDTIGTRDARVEGELLAIEEKNKVLCARLRLRYTETTGANPVIVQGLYWIEVGSGDKVASEVSVANLPLGSEESLASGEIKEIREGEGPLALDAVIKGQTGIKPEQGAGNTKQEPVKPPEPKKDKTIDEIVKDYEKIPGVLTLYRKKEPTKDTLYAEIREDQLDRLMLLQATASTGTAEQVVAGDPINDLVFQFTRSSDDKLYLAVPNLTFQAKPGTPLARAVRRSFSDSYLLAFKIEAKQGDRKSLLIDVSELFRSDLAQISSAFSGAPSIPGMVPSAGMGLDREKTFIQQIRNFPENLVVATQYAFARGSTRGVSSVALPDPRSAAIQVTYNLSSLPTGNGYRPRLADSRVGYFATESFHFDQDNKEDLATRYILRWQLEKKDPQAPLSEPVHPIVFWLDNAIPIEYRDAVRDGLLVWNKAFEKIGFKDAIVVRQMPDTPDPKDTNVPSDTADMRFNVIRWVVSPENAYAVALFRANPLTGQILNASITVDAGIVRYTKVERKDIVEPATAFLRAALSRSERESLEQIQHSLPQRATGPDQRCELAEELRREAWYGYQAMRLFAISPISEAEYAQQFIREVVAHEFGHILGLRHNFVATTQFSLAQLANPKIVGAGGIGASVMDYNAFNIAALKSRNVAFYSQTIGTYDYWAIEYGYVPVSRSQTPQDEKPTLAQIARRSGQPGHEYHTDEEADSFDPRITRFDLSSDPLAYWEENLKVSQSMLSKLDKRLPAEGESYWEFTRAFQMMLGMYARGAGQISRFVGAQNIGRSHKGDIGEKPSLMPVSVAQQKKAILLLNRYVFSPGGITIPSRYFTRLSPDFSSYPAFPSEFPVADQLSNLQRSVLRRLFSGTTLTRIANNEFKMGGDETRALTLPYLFQSVSGNVWAELNSATPVGTLRRNLQRSHLDLAIDLALKGGGPEDARMLAWAQLRQLKPRLDAAMKRPGLNTYTRLHYQDSLGKINRALSAQQTIGGGGGGSATSLLQLLLGGSE